METTDKLSTILAQRIHDLEKRNRKLNSRINTLERTRDRQRATISGLYYQLALHRSRVRSARQSRDLWRHRCMLKENG